MSAEKYRITTGAKSFDLEQFGGVDKDGEEVWRKLGFYRNRKDAVCGCAVHGLGDEMASKLPKYHPDAYRALAGFLSPSHGPSEETRRKMAETRERNTGRGNRANDSTPPDHQPQGACGDD